jgi:SPP1 family predicted phage head-tail adaptor
MAKGENVMGIVQRYFVDTTLKTVTETSDGIGGIIKTYVSTTIKAYVSQINEKSSVDKIRASGLSLIGTYVIMCPYDTALHKNDRIIFNDKDFIVKSVPMNPANKNHHLFAYLEEV